MLLGFPGELTRDEVRNPDDSLRHMTLHFSETVKNRKIPFAHMNIVGHSLMLTIVQFAVS